MRSRTAASKSTTPGLGNVTLGRPRPRLFRALGAAEPPDHIEVRGAVHQLVKVLKHDSWAATALYAGPGGRIVCKFHRQQSIAKVPMRWLGRLLARHEASLLRRLANLPNVPRLSGDVFVSGTRCSNAVAHDYVPGHPLGRNEHVGESFFAALAGFLTEMHRRGIAYVDLHKRENIIVGDDGRPYLVDFQISIALPRWWPANSWLTRPLLRVLQCSDTYHLRKHVAACRPDLCGTFGMDSAKVQRPWWIKGHRLLAVPFRRLRRWLLVVLGIRTGRGRVESEHFAEDAVRQDPRGKRAAA